MLKFENQFTNHNLIGETLASVLPFKLSETVFFDIETTGFTAKNSKIYLIGCLYFNNSTKEYFTCQFFLDDDNESLLLCEFFQFIKQFKNLVHFNGNGFDIPFVLQKCAAWNLLYNFSNMTGFDLYKEAVKYKDFLKTVNLKQRTLEEFFGLNRTDQFSGGELINVYYDYTKTQKQKLIDSLLLHNLEDIKGMLTILNIYSYAPAFSGEFLINNVSINSFRGYNDIDRQELLVECDVDTPVTKRISGGNDIYYFSLYNNKLKINVQARTGELKFFYPDYKNYYYLPKEDCAIHKSVAFYVDKDFRTQAKAATCYSKKTGCFLPQNSEIIRPYFKVEYHDKTMYFEADDSFLNDKDKIKSYILYVLNLLKKR